jgi:hypothetical protein
MKGKSRTGRVRLFLRIPAQSIKEHKAVAGYDCHLIAEKYTSLEIYFFILTSLLRYLYNIFYQVPVILEIRKGSINESKPLFNE